MFLATAALHLATEKGVCVLEILRPGTRGAADFIGANHIATANDHALIDMLLRTSCK